MREWGNVYDVDSDLSIYEPAESETEARALVAASPTDTGLVYREVSEWVHV